MARRIGPIKQNAAAWQGVAAAAVASLIVCPITMWIYELDVSGLERGLGIGFLIELPVIFVGFPMMQFRESRPTRTRRWLEAIGAGLGFSFAVAIFAWLASSVSVALGCLCFAMVVLPVIFSCGYAVRFRRGTWPPLPGCCWRCDYNLTGNTSGVCPECGTTIDGERSD